MLYSPFFEALGKFEKQITDFFVYLSIYLIAFGVDSYVFINFDRNWLLLSLFVMIFSYIGARLIIKRFKKAHLFGTFVNWNMQYCVFLAVFSWFCYVLFIRHRYGL